MHWVKLNSTQTLRIQKSARWRMTFSLAVLGTCDACSLWRACAAWCASRGLCGCRTDVLLCSLPVELVVFIASFLPRNSADKKNVRFVSRAVRQGNEEKTHLTFRTVHPTPHTEDTAHTHTPHITITTAATTHHVVASLWYNAQHVTNKFHRDWSTVPVCACEHWHKKGHCLATSLSTTVAAFTALGRSVAVRSWLLCDWFLSLLHP